MSACFFTCSPCVAWQIQHHGPNAGEGSTLQKCEATQQTGAVTTWQVNLPLGAGAHLWAGCQGCGHCDEDCQEHSADGPHRCVHHPPAFHRHLRGTVSTQTRYQQYGLLKHPVLLYLLKHRNGTYISCLLAFLPGCLRPSMDVIDLILPAVAMYQNYQHSKTYIE